MKAGTDPSRKVPPARTVLFAILREYVPDTHGRTSADQGAWTEVLVEALELAGVREKAARQAIARLANEGMISAERHGRRVQWRLTDKGRRWLAEGAVRAERFAPRADRRIGRWMLLSVPLNDEQRDLRYHLNRRLVSLGWGSIGNGTWLNSGAVSEATVTTTLRRLGLEHRAVFARAEFRAPTRLEDLVERAWDLSSIGARYRDFLSRHDGREPLDDREAFARRTRVIADFTHSLWTDPRLPRELLPDGWPGTAGMELVRHAHADWQRPARRWWTGAQQAAGRAGASTPRG
jgi:phenylacetic acid degradation operon negative regulatory protein